MATGSVALGLEQQVVLLAGVEASAGESIAQAFAESGAWVVVHSCQDLDGTKRIVDRVRSNGGRAMPAIGVTDDAAAAWALIERIVVEWAQLDVLVCDVAGLATRGGRTVAADSSVPLEVAYVTAEAITRMRGAGGGRIIVLLPPAADPAVGSWRVAGAERRVGTEPGRGDVRRSGAGQCRTAHRVCGSDRPGARAAIPRQCLEHGRFRLLPDAARLVPLPAEAGGLPLSTRGEGAGG